MEYVYSVKITQPNLPGTFQEAMKLLDAELWRAAAKRWAVSKTFRSTSCSLTRQFLLGNVYTNRGGCSKSRLTTLTRRAWWLEAGVKSQEKTAATPTLLFADFRAFEWCGYRRRDGIEGGTARRENCFLVRNHLGGSVRGNDAWL